ncbi:sterol 14 alpha-demethylase [Daedaleopsis nitida]|nr:sterol 14 alpha-demethylase [Daedaleopsis nitida]
MGANTAFNAYRTVGTSAPPVLLLALVLFAPLAVLLNALWQLRPRPKSQPPMVWHWIPVLGSALAYGRDPLGFFRECREKYGDCFTFILMGKRVTVTLGAHGNEYVFGGKHTQLAAEDVYAPLTTPIFGKDVVYDCPNEKLMEQKKFVKVSLTVDRFRSYVGMIEDEVKDYLNHDPSFHTYQNHDSHDWGTLSVLKTFSEITILTASRTLQGSEVRERLSKDFAQVYSDLDHGFTPLHWMIPSLPLPSYRKRDAAHAKMSSFYQSIIKRRRESPSEHEDDDVMSTLMTQRYRDGTPLPDHEIANLLITLLMAGQHTSSSSLAWAVLHLAARPDVQDALYAEQRAPDGSLRARLGYDELRALKVLDAVVRETLRHHPPIHSIMRKARTDVPVPATLAAPAEDVAFVVPAGDIVLACPLVSQLDPAVWADAETWEPGRWYDEKGVAARAAKRYSDGEKVDFGFGLVSKGTSSPYLPFGAGRHRCIGEQFAYLQIGTVISALIRRMEFRLEEEFPRPDYSSMMVQPMPCQIMYRRRK